jgi:hypothetical protein
MPAKRRINEPASFRSRGDPLTRSYNGGTAVPVLDDCREFALAYDKRSQKDPASYTESAESVLYSFNAGLIASINTTSPLRYNLQASTSYGAPIN